MRRNDQARGGSRVQSTAEGHARTKTNENEQPRKTWIADVKQKNNCRLETGSLRR
jgi:hypothetical protein